MKEKDLKVNEIKVEVYYSIDEDTDELIFDEEGMREDFELQLKKLMNNKLINDDDVYDFFDLDE